MHGKDAAAKRFPSAAPLLPLSIFLRLPTPISQYFHYLTKWAFALSRMALARGDRQYCDLALQLAKGVHPRFVYPDPETAR